MSLFADFGDSFQSKCYTFAGWKSVGYIGNPYEYCVILFLAEAHRTLLEDHVSKIITDFCDGVPTKLKTKTEEHESELKRFFWKKGTLILYEKDASTKVYRNFDLWETP